MMMMTINNFEEVLELITNSNEETKRAFREEMTIASNRINWDLTRVRRALLNLFGIDSYDVLLINWQWGRFERAAQ